MRPSLLLLVAAAAPLAGCPSGPVEATPESTTEGATTEATTTTPTDPGATQIMTTDNTVGSTMPPTSDATTTTGATDPTTESGESTGGGASVIVEGLSHPESILHDTVDDVYLISNINGDPGMVDDNGFISRVLPDGSVEELKWIDSANGDVTLDAPKGLAIFGEVLYVADLTFVRKFDRTTGAPLGDIEIPGAAFLNDLAASPFGNIYASDTMTDTLHVIGPDDSITTMLTSPDLTGPNGLVYTGEYLMVAAYNGNQLFQVPFEGPQALVAHTFEFGSLDGLVAVDGGLLVSSWEMGKSGVYMLSTDLTTVTSVIEGIDSPADIEVDLGRNTLLVPVLLGDRAEFYPL